MFIGDGKAYHCIGHNSQVKGKVWSKIMFCVWFAFAVKIVVANGDDRRAKFSLVY